MDENLGLQTLESGAHGYIMKSFVWNIWNSCFGLSS